jgi:hypothetical protein
MDSGRKTNVRRNSTRNISSLVGKAVKTVEEEKEINGFIIVDHPLKRMRSATRELSMPSN